VEQELAPSGRQADRRPQAILVIDDTALPKKGSHSVGVASQYASALGKHANCQALVPLALAQDEVPVMIGPRLFLPENWTSDGMAPGDRDLRQQARLKANASRQNTINLGQRGLGLRSRRATCLRQAGLRHPIGASDWMLAPIGVRIPKHQKVYPSAIRAVRMRRTAFHS
jgi:DDE superfamily endonuclease